MVIDNRQSKLKISLSEYATELLAEWDYELNNISPEEINYGSEKIIHWKCIKCNSSYKTKLNKRTCGKSNCPFCDGKKINHTNSLGDLYPELVKRLKNINDAFIVTASSAKKLEWQCDKCLEYYFATSSLIRSSSLNFNGCPFCSGKIANNKNNITVTHPYIAKEWHYDKNLTIPEQHTAGSGCRNKVWWKCEFNHEWQASINTRTGTKNKRGSGCPNCCHKISHPENEWLDSLNILNLEKQKKIIIGKKSFKVDGFDSVANTIYEFYGDYYHGNPKIYNLNDFNKKCKKTFGELYQKTIDKENLLKKNYNLVIMWEKDWKESLNNKKIILSKYLMFA